MKRLHAKGGEKKERKAFFKPDYIQPTGRGTLQVNEEKLKCDFQKWWERRVGIYMIAYP